METQKTECSELSTEELSSEECSLFQKVLGTVEKLASDKLLQLPAEPFFTEGQVKSLGI